MGYFGIFLLFYSGIEIFQAFSGLFKIFSDFLVFFGERDTINPEETIGGKAFQRLWFHNEQYVTLLVYYPVQEVCYQLPIFVDLTSCSYCLYFYLLQAYDMLLLLQSARDSSVSFLSQLFSVPLFFALFFSLQFTRNQCCCYYSDNKNVTMLD